uniref:ectoine synthase n=1 Tax=Pantanalinema rosaneae TaxID=1620701 RepID=UPI003D6FD74F
MIVRQYSSAPTKQIFASRPSRNLVAPEDGMGHLLFDTLLRAGEQDVASPPEGLTAQAHYCVSGRGVVVIGGRIATLSPGRIVAASGAGECAFEAVEDMKICSVYGVADVDGVFVERSLAEIEGTERTCSGARAIPSASSSTRDGLGFAVCVTIGHADKDSPLEYRNHLESCYYIEARANTSGGTDGAKSRQRTAKGPSS